MDRNTELNIRAAIFFALAMTAFFIPMALASCVVHWWPSTSSVWIDRFFLVSAGVAATQLCEATTKRLLQHARRHQR